MKITFAILALIGTGCALTPPDTSIPTLYYSKEELPRDCASLGNVDHTLVIAEDSPDQNVPLGELNSRVIHEAGALVTERGGDALLVKSIQHADYSGLRAFQITCVCEAFRCK
jgi:hypothetical protein